MNGEYRLSVQKFIFIIIVLQFILDLNKLPFQASNYVYIILVIFKGLSIVIYSTIMRGINISWRSIDTFNILIFGRA